MGVDKDGSCNKNQKAGEQKDSLAYPRGGKQATGMLF
ncbi:hypothetical protein EPYR_02763 [Erwinia pyrifoliae DSM 12163]|nr:hypothetical protein EPYR_02763 [Erwinia pyrifoliae DSM 12163]